jgi:ribosomal-protein-alanine N-acetyltransferase
MSGPEADKFQVRSYLPQDFEALYALDQQCFVPEIAYARDDLRYFLETKDAVVLVADAGGTLGGFLIALLYRGRATFQARIITIDVDPSQRQIGVGSLLMDACEVELRRNLVTRVRLEVSVLNLAAQKFYRKYGYETISKLPEYYPTGEDAWAMQKTL